MNRLQYFAVMVICGWLLLAMAGLWVTSANHVALNDMFAFPRLEITGLLGYDDLGRSIISRIISGARISLQVAVTVTIITALIGTLFGMVSAWFSGFVDIIMVRIMDIFLAFPGILLAIALAGLLGPGIDNVIIALAVTGWVGFARLARAQVLSLKSREHIMAAQSLGSSSLYIMSRHLLPLMMAPLLIEATFSIAGTVIAEAGLSFLGLGVQAPQASWGGMLRDGVRYLLVAPHMMLAPAIAIMLVVLSVNLLGDHLRDRLDIRLRD